MSLEHSDDGSALSGLALTFQCGLYRDKHNLVACTMQNLRQQAVHFLARKYPEHPYINLGSSLTFNILADGNNPDRPLESIKDLYEDCIVNICLTSQAQTSRHVINPHTLAVKSYRSPAFCDYCGQMLFGLVRQGLQCEGCGYNFHKRCAYRIPNNCPGVRPQPKTPRRFSRYRNDKGERGGGGGGSAVSSSASIGSYTLPSQNSVDSAVSSNRPDRRASLMHQAKSIDHTSLQSSPAGLVTSPNHSHGFPGGAGKPPKRSNSWYGRPVWIDRELASRQYLNEVEVPHTFATRSYKRPTICMHCRRLLIGILRQGMQCKDCKYNVHRNCAKSVPKNCLSQILTELEKTSELGAIAGADNSSGELSAQGSVSSPTQDDDDDMLGDDFAGEEGDGGLENGETESIRSVVVRRPSNDSEFSANIPLQRVYVSVPKNGNNRLETIKEGWMVCFSTLKKVRELYYWKLDTRHLFMHRQPDDPESVQEIPLSSMLAISVPTKAEPIPPNTTAHCFEIKIGREGVYYIGEKSSPEASSIHSNKSYVFPEECSMTMADALAKAVGEKRCKPWEDAIRGAFMPVTPKPSIKTVVSVTESTNIMDDISGPIEPGPPGQPAPMFRQYNSSTLDISDFYQIFSDECLGSGQFGVVYGGVHRVSGRPVAVKVIDKLRFPSKQETALKNEVAILHTLNHPGVVNLERMFETPDRVFVVMEKMEGDMLEMILRNPIGRLEERITRFIVFQILTALQHLHSQSIVHCDLKPENVLLRGSSSFPQIKLCDFGFARIIGEKSFRKSVVGTPAYLAPEVLNNAGYDRSLDMWSVGVIIYVSLSGTFPFNEDEEIAEQIQNADFMYPTEPWNEISREAVELINILLQVNKARRCTARQALIHDFLSGKETWHDLRKLEQEVGKRYLTHPAEDQFMLKETRMDSPPSGGSSGGKVVGASPLAENGVGPVTTATGSISTGVVGLLAGGERVTNTIVESTELAGRKPGNVIDLPIEGAASSSAVPSPGVTTPTASGSIMSGKAQSTLENGGSSKASLSDERVSPGLTKDLVGGVLRFAALSRQSNVSEESLSGSDFPRQINPSIAFREDLSDLANGDHAAPDSPDHRENLTAESPPLRVYQTSPNRHDGHTRNELWDHDTGQGTAAGDNDTSAEPCAERRRGPASAINGGLERNRSYYNSNV